ncbi:MAG TPA: BMP family ABC transporter substrate-binding protein [Anaerolineaceae bacterium]|nr:BMP family ABC transporter substrate-binding protein [Anaerolineaceae bacterium]
MFKKTTWLVISLIAISSMLLAACGPAATTAAPQPTTPPATAAPTAGPLVFGMVYVGPYNDKGWSQAHYDAAQYVTQKIPGSKLVYIDKGNSADRPGTTVSQLAEQLLAQGAKAIAFTSDDMKDDAIGFAKKHTDIPVIFASGDTVWKDGKAYQDLPNMVNIMGRMEYMKFLAGCSAALTTQTGKIGFLGPLINDETRRLASSAFLGAKYCWTKYAGKNASDLQFKVTWIGFWFNIPGVTSDPTQVANDFYNGGYDVVISGIDTTEALVQANKATQAGTKVFAVSYDYAKGCDEAPTVCLGVPYFNWGPMYVKYLNEVQAGTFKQAFEWAGPDWTNINNPDTGAVGFNKGQGLSAAASANLDKFLAELAGGLNLWKGPLNLQDKTVYLKDGETATDQQIWYLPQLLEGMQGQSVPTK